LQFDKPTQVVGHVKPAQSATEKVLDAAHPTLLESINGLAEATVALASKRERAPDRIAGNGRSPA
jgi:hypothetical protein